MLKYLIIQLAKDSVSFCHYQKGEKSGELISIDSLRDAIFWAMKENLNIQVLYPDYTIPDEYKNLLDSIDHADIVSSKCEDKSLSADIIVHDNWDDINEPSLYSISAHVIRTSKTDLFQNTENLIELLKSIKRLIITITDIDSFSNDDFNRYSKLLDDLVSIVKNEYLEGHAIQFNMLTDRMLLDEMNNCNAGAESITLAPDGNFYICPAFYLDGAESVGNLKDGVDIKNKQLYRLDHAPICRNCDSYQCRRCIWLNKKTTLEVNTPSHEQCVISHIERNASKKLLDSIREIGSFLPEKNIEKIDYLDPFEKLSK